MIPPKNNSEQDKSQKNDTEASRPKRQADGKFPADLTPVQVGMMTADEKADYMMQLAIGTLNENTSKTK